MDLCDAETHTLDHHVPTHPLTMDGPGRPFTSSEDVLFPWLGGAGVSTSGDRLFGHMTGCSGHMVDGQATVGSRLRMSHHVVSELPMLRRWPLMPEPSGTQAHAPPCRTCALSWSQNGTAVCAADPQLHALLKTRHHGGASTLCSEIGLVVLHSQGKCTAGDHPIQTEPRWYSAGGLLCIPAPTQSLVHDPAW